jgi:nicotinamidase/pyrazinamidase
VDALSLGLRVFVVADACRGVDLRPGDSALALDEMAAHGARIVRSADVPSLLKSTK